MSAPGSMSAIWANIKAGCATGRNIDEFAFQRALGRVGALLGPCDPELRTLPPAETDTTADPNGTFQSLSREAWLLLHALRQVAVVGKCNTWRPLPWDDRSAVWDAWKAIDSLGKGEARREFAKHVSSLLPVAAAGKSSSWLPPMLSFRAGSDADELPAPDARTTPNDLVGTWKFVGERGSKRRFMVSYGVPAMLVGPLITKASMTFKWVELQQPSTGKRRTVLARTMDDAPSSEEEFAGIERGGSAGAKYELAHEITRKPVHEQTAFVAGVLSVRSACESFTDGDMLVQWWLVSGGEASLVAGLEGLQGRPSASATLVEVGRFGGELHYARFYVRVAKKLLL